MLNLMKLLRNSTRWFSRGFLPKKLESAYIESTPPIKEIDTETVPIFAQGNEVFVTILAEDPFPSSITSYSWKGIYNNRGISTI